MRAVRLHFHQFVQKLDRYQILGATIAGAAVAVGRVGKGLLRSGMPFAQIFCTLGTGGPEGS